MHSLMNLAEVRYLQGNIDSALAYWTECKDQILTLYMDGPILMMGNTAPACFIESLLGILQRVVRFMFCFDGAFVNKVCDTFVCRDDNKRFHYSI